METAIQQSVTLEEGIPCNFEITFLDALSAPVDLTGYSFILHAKNSLKDTQPTITLSSAAGTITSEPLQGKIILKFASTDSMDKGTRLVYGLIGFDSSMVPFKIAKGVIDITQAITRWWT